MYLLGHTGIAAGIADLLRTRAPRLPVDVRWVLLGSMLADLIDKPVGFAAGIGGRAVAHTGIFALALTLLTLGVRGAWRPAVVGLALGNWTHLAADGMWGQPDVLLYPAFGWAFPPATLLPIDLLRILLSDPYLWVTEAVGAAILVALAIRHRVTSWAALRRFLASGRLPPSKTAGATRTGPGSKSE